MQWGPLTHCRRAGCVSEVPYPQRLVRTVGVDSLEDVDGHVGHPSEAAGSSAPGFFLGCPLYQEDPRKGHEKLGS